MTRKKDDDVEGVEEVKTEAEAGVADGEGKVMAEQKEVANDDDKEVEPDTEDNSGKVMREQQAVANADGKEVEPVNPNAGVEAHTAAEAQRISDQVHDIARGIRD